MRHRARAYVEMVLREREGTKHDILAPQLVKLIMTFYDIIPREWGYN